MLTDIPFSFLFLNALVFSITMIAIRPQSIYVCFSCIPSLGNPFLNTAATPLDKSTTDRIRKSIESSKIAKEYKSLKVTNKVHADLIGGIIVDFGDEKTVDLSVKSRVQKLDQLISRE